MRDLRGLAKRWPKRTLAERFWSKVERGEKSKCWPYQGYKIPQGYGTFQICKGLWKYAHRLAYELHFGWFEPHWHVLHKCDAPACCNPHHLRLGTHAENMAEMRQRGRHRKVPV